MIGMLLGDDARKAAGSTFGLENELVAQPQNDSVTPKEIYAISQLHPR